MSSFLSSLSLEPSLMTARCNRMLSVKNDKNDRSWYVAANVVHRVGPEKFMWYTYILSGLRKNIPLTKSNSWFFGRKLLFSDLIISYLFQTLSWSAICVLHLIFIRYYFIVSFLGFWWRFSYDSNCDLPHLKFKLSFPFNT